MQTHPITNKSIKVINVRFKPAVLAALRTISYETRQSIQHLIMEGVEKTLKKYSELLEKRQEN